jgi:Zn-dependent peptidase ImmA (M78 family)
MPEFTVFGRPDRFEIALRWRHDRERRAQRPLGYGWSMGDLRLTVAGQVITRHHRGDAPQTYVSWYLLPVLEWLAEHWPSLLHESEFAWPEASSAPAAMTCNRALNQWISTRDDAGRARYKTIHAWWARHALRAHSEGGLFPDLFLRRYLDQIEVSWSDNEPLFAPGGFRFIARAGTVYLPVADVATPLWDALNWALIGQPPLAPEDRGTLDRLRQRIAALRSTTVIDFASMMVSAEVWRTASAAAMQRDVELDGRMVENVPAVAEFSPAVAMFGGVSPQLGYADAVRLVDLVVAQRHRHESKILRRLVDGQVGPPTRAPYTEGYALAEQILDNLDPLQNPDWVDVRGLAEHLGVAVVELRLDTDSVRGVALAGDSIGPVILVNLSSFYNGDEEGRRFTIAHELCHILFDRTHAQHVGITSGPWAPAGIEKRANAFAAMLLMPRDLVIRALTQVGRRIDGHAVNRLAGALHVSESALVEHLYNLDIIDEIQRESLRSRSSR